MPIKEAINAKGAAKPIGPYSTALSYGDLIFISGQIPVNSQTGKIPDSISEHGTISWVRSKPSMKSYWVILVNYQWEKKIFTGRYWCQTHFPRSPHARD